MPCNFYFYDVNGGAELKDHPLNGIYATGCGAGLDINGKPRDRADAGPLWKDKHGRIARTQLWARLGNGRGPEKRITIEDFPGRRHVLVKEWVPKEAQYPTQWFYLVPEENRLNSPR